MKANIAILKFFPPRDANNIRSRYFVVKNLEKKTVIINIPVLFFSIIIMLYITLSNKNAKFNYYLLSHTGWCGTGAVIVVM